MTARLVPPTAFEGLEIEDMRDGRYKISFVPLREGCHFLEVFFGSEDGCEMLKGAPFALSVGPPDDTPVQLGADELEPQANGGIQSSLQEMANHLSRDLYPSFLVDCAAGNSDGSAHVRQDGDCTKALETGQRGEACGGAGRGQGAPPGKLPLRGAPPVGQVLWQQGFAPGPTKSGRLEPVPEPDYVDETSSANKVETLEPSTRPALRTTGARGGYSSNGRMPVHRGAGDVLTHHTYAIMKGRLSPRPRAPSPKSKSPRPNRPGQQTPPAPLQAARGMGGAMGGARPGPMRPVMGPSRTA